MTKLIIALNKSDLDGTVLTTNKIREALKDCKISSEVPILPISAKNGTGIDALLKELQKTVAANDETDNVMITNLRHCEALTKAADSSQRVISGLQDNLSGDLIAQDLRETIFHLGTITGNITSQDILTNIFSRFCIGK